jgi:hypothetical protein
MGILFGQWLVSFHIARTLSHTQLSHQAHQEQMTIWYSPTWTQFITNLSITHAKKMMHALAECVKAIQGMTGKARNSQAGQDLQHIIDATQAHVQTNPHNFDETITPDNIYNMQQVPWGQAPPSVHIPHTNDNRQITCSMHPQAPIPRVPTDTPRVKPISAPLIATAIKPSSKPTTLAAESSKRKHHHKRQATGLCNAVTPTSPTTHIRTWAQMATAAAWVTPPSLNTHSCTW